LPQLLLKRQKRFSTLKDALAIPPRRDLYGKKSITGYHEEVRPAK
jgi:hypothetical protein